MLTSVDSRLIKINLVYLAFIAFLPFPTDLLGTYFDCETVFRRPSRSDPCFDWPVECPGVDLSAGPSDAPSGWRAERAVTP